MRPAGICIASLLTCAIMWGQPPAFEVASVRPSNPEQGYINSRTPSLKVDGGRRVTFAQTTLRDMIMLAYGVGAPQIQGPAWLRGNADAAADRYEVMATVPVGASREQVPLMLQALLAERFHLAVHRESKEIQVFSLEVAKGGLKMMPDAEDATGGAAGCVRAAAERAGATLAATCRHMTGEDIAQQLQALAPGYFREGPVMDATGLKGTYGFTLEWITNAQANNGRDGPTMFKAVEALGLKLEKKKQQVQMLVVDKLDRIPVEN